jgi:DNA-binding response OmpR family regulator/HPt (histidine-containing phosphotransfer) domain-containing protein
MKILVVEDDEFTAGALTSVLDKHRYTIEVASDGQAAWELVQAFGYDLILLDVMLPKLDGISLCQKMRTEGYRMPILLLTGRDSSHDKAIGLDAGADDYVVKPFSEEELMARIRALLRRGGGAIALPILEWGGLHLDPSACEVSYETQLLSLTPKEYGILELFLRNPHRVFNCGMIIEHLWSYEEAPGEEAVRTHIKGLRHKFKKAGVPIDPIETVYGIGYRVKPLDTAVEKDKQEASQQTLVAVAEVWNRFQKRVAEQIAVLDQAAVALADRSLAQELEQKAIQEAHTLAGALGTFGFMEGSQRAREIEHLLQSEHEPKARQLHQLVHALRQEIGHGPTTSTRPPA